MLFKYKIKGKSLLNTAVILALLGGTTVGTSLAAGKNDFPVIVKNETNNPGVKNIYITIKGSTPDTKRPCFVKFSSKNPGTVGVCEPISDTQKNTHTTDGQYDYPYNYFSDGTFHLPYVESGRMYISINKPVSFFINEAGGIADPSISPAANDVNKNILFDKVEFTYLTNGNTWFNPTAVDFLSLPVSIKQANPNGEQIYGMTENRKKAFDTIRSLFNNELSSAEDKKKFEGLFIKAPNGADLRILASGRDASTFDDHYLDQYRNALFNYYKNGQHSLKFNLKEIGCFGNSDARGIFNFKVDSNNNAIFENSQGEKLIFPQSAVNSNFFPMADTDRNQIIVNGLGGCNVIDVESTAIKFFTSLWAVGLLPAEDGALIDEPYIRQKIAKNLQENGSHYSLSSSKLLALNGGPWYHLYGKAIHTVTSHLYAFPYDDVLGLDGTNGSNDTHPATLTISSMEGSLLPDEPAPAPVSCPAPTNNGSKYLEGNYSDLVNLQWNAPTDSSKLTGYKLYNSTGSSVLLNINKSVTYTQLTNPTETVLSNGKTGYAFNFASVCGTEESSKVKIEIEKPNFVCYPPKDNGSAYENGLIKLRWTAQTTGSDASKVAKFLLDGSPTTSLTDHTVSNPVVSEVINGVKHYRYKLVAECFHGYSVPLELDITGDSVNPPPTTKSYTLTQVVAGNGGKTFTLTDGTKTYTRTLNSISLLDSKRATVNLPLTITQSDRATQPCVIDDFNPIKMGTGCGGVILHTVNLTNKEFWLEIPASLSNTSGEIPAPTPGSSVKIKEIVFGNAGKTFKVYQFNKTTSAYELLISLPKAQVPAYLDSTLRTFSLPLKIESDGKACLLDDKAFQTLGVSGLPHCIGIVIQKSGTTTDPTYNLIGPAVLN